MYVQIILSLFSCTTPDSIEKNSSLDLDGDGHVAIDDCDDENSTVYVGAPELCDGLDNNCNEEIDEDSTFHSEYFMDSDGDGYGSSDHTIWACTPPEGYVLQGEDCDDTSALRSPGVAEICDDLDNNCDGHIDEDTATDAQDWFLDHDGDGFGDPHFLIHSCDAPMRYVENADDCQDLDATIYPGAMELCNGMLDDCLSYDGLQTDGLWPVPDAERDLDGDGYIECDFTLESWRNYAHIPLGGGDCDDQDPAIYPEATERCNGIYDDCLNIDMGSAPEDEIDDDGDGYVECEQSDVVLWFGDPIDGGGDCNDADPYVFPGAAELGPEPDACLRDADEDGYPDCTLDRLDYTCDASIFLNNNIGLDFMLINSEDGFSGSAFYMGKTEVTAEVFASVMGYTLSGTGEMPVHQLNWHEAAYFSNLLSDLHNLDSCYDCVQTDPSDPRSMYCLDSIYTAIEDCSGYRLLRDEEWTFAGLANASGHFWTDQGGGSLGTGQGFSCLPTYLDDGTLLDDYAWHCGNSSGVQLVATRSANAFGIYDIHGNVQEWIHDASTGLAEHRLMRGGAAFNEPFRITINRSVEWSEVTTNVTQSGFRVGRTLP